MCGMVLLKLKVMVMDGRRKRTCHFTSGEIPRNPPYTLQVNQDTTHHPSPFNTPNTLLQVNNTCVMSLTYLTLHDL